LTQLNTEQASDSYYKSKKLEIITIFTSINSDK